MDLREDVYDIKKELRDIKQDSFAMEMLKYSKKQNKILFVIILILLVFLFATGSYLIWLLNDIGVEEVTEESYDVIQDDGTNSFVNGNDNNVNNGSKN